MAPFRNPFGRKPPVVNGNSALQDENAPPSKLNGDASSQRSGYASSRASSSLSIKKREEPSEYKLSGKFQCAKGRNLMAGTSLTESSGQ